MTEWIYDPRAGRCRKTDGGQTMSDIDDCRKFVENLTRDRGEVMRAGDDKIAEIRERHSRDERWRNSPSMISPQSHDDRATLLAEVERLTGKLKLVADALNETISKYHEVGDQNDRLDAENERLTRERDEARAEYARLCDDIERIENDAWHDGAKHGTSH